QQDDEFVTGISADDTDRRRELAQGTGDDAKYGVALQVAVIVVDVLELVDVDDEQRNRRERTAVRENLARDVDERAARDETGEVVGRASDAQVARRRSAFRRDRLDDGALSERRRARLHHVLEVRK